MVEINIKNKEEALKELKRRRERFTELDMSVI
jgi:hypothetical protein